jgi:hypothetical protein
MRRNNIRGTTQIAFVKMPLKALTQLYGQDYSVHPAGSYATFAAFVL